MSLRLPKEFLLFFIAIFCLSCTAPKAFAPVKADFILQDAVVYTVDAARSWAEAVAISKGRIVYVGTNRGVKEWTGPETKILSLKGKMVLPGFHDSHVHPISGGIELGECNLNDAPSQAAILDTIRHYAATHPDTEWIRGGGWDLPVFPNANPHKKLLDAIVPDRPVFLSAADGHSGWANSLALNKAGITRATPDPPQGRIERDPTSGEPTGTLREDAMALVTEHMPPYTQDDYVKGLRRGLALANRFGITSLQEASANKEMLEAYRMLDQQGALTARVVVSMKVNPAQWSAQIPQFIEWRKTYRGTHLRAHTVKIFADGVIEARTAALLEPYLDQPGSRGSSNMEPAALDSLVTALDKEGFQVHIHAIGDRAVRMGLDAFETARTHNGIRDSRHHMAHIQLIDPADLSRFRQLGVIANFQPLWAYADTYITELTEPALGPERSRWLYPIESIVQTGAGVVFGSDWSVSSMNPLDGIQVGVTRRALADTTANSWIPQERADLSTMIAGYTIKGAYLNFQEHETGSIETGKAADLVVLDRNIFDIPAQKIHLAKVLLTLLEGQVVYQAEDW